jgi:hypothetical protein
MKMKSLKFIVRLSLFVLVLFAVAASTHAQQCPGYNPTMSQGAPGSASGILPPSPCAGKSLFSTASFYETNSTTDYCGSLDTGGYLSHTATVTGNGVASCTPVVVYCEPFFEAQVTVAANQQDYNRFYYRAYDYTYTSSGCVRTPFTRQDFWQCPWYSCPPPPGGGGGGGGGGPRYCNPCDGSNDSTCCSPILIDTTGHGYFLTDATNGVLFDITADGTPIQMAWTAAGSGDAFRCCPKQMGWSTAAGTCLAVGHRNLHPRIQTASRPWPCTIFPRTAGTAMASSTPATPSSRRCGCGSTPITMASASRKNYTRWRRWA